MAICTTCGEAVREGAGFCNGCGSAVEPTPLVCSHCGAAMRSKARFCGDCGAPADLFAPVLSTSAVAGASTAAEASTVPPAPLAFVASGAGGSASVASATRADQQVQAPAEFTTGKRPPLRWNDWLILGGAAAGLSLRVLVAVTSRSGPYEPLDLVVLVQGAALVVVILFALLRIPSHGRLRYGILTGLGVASSPLPSLLFLLAGIVVLTGAVAGLIKPRASSPECSPIRAPGRRSP